MKIIIVIGILCLISVSNISFSQSIEAPFVNADLNSYLFFGCGWTGLDLLQAHKLEEYKYLSHYPLTALLFVRWSIGTGLQNTRINNLKQGFIDFSCQIPLSEIKGFESTAKRIAVMNDFELSSTRDTIIKQLMKCFDNYMAEFTIYTNKEYTFIYKSSKLFGSYVDRARNGEYPNQRAILCEDVDKSDPLTYFFEAKREDYDFDRHTINIKLLTRENNWSDGYEGSEFGNCKGRSSARDYEKCNKIPNYIDLKMPPEMANKLFGSGEKIYYRHILTAKVEPMIRNYWGAGYEVDIFPYITIKKIKVLFYKDNSLSKPILGYDLNISNWSTITSDFFEVVYDNNSNDLVTPVESFKGQAAEKNNTLNNGMQVEISSIPAGSGLFIDDKFVGITPFSGKLSLGNHLLQIENNGKKTEKQVQITQDNISNFSLAINSNYSETSSGLNLDMVFVEGGTFQMGSTDGEGNEEPVHSVTLNDFFIGKYEVTQKQWRAIMGSDPPALHFKGYSDKFPVESVSWDDVQKFIQKLNEKTGMNYRLPSEAEWEYAAKGGNKTKGYLYSGSNTIDNVAWYNDNSLSIARPVGQKQANELGLYDMSGNVWEWCNDWYSSDYYKISPTLNPQGPASGTYHVYRGCGWYYSRAKRCRVSYRSNDNPDKEVIGMPAYKGSLGFRLVLRP